MEPCRQKNRWDTGKSHFLPRRKRQKHKKPTATGTSAAQLSVSKCSYLLKKPGILKWLFHRLA